MCAAVGKLFNDYSRLKATHAFVEALESDTGIPVSELIQSVRGGDPAFQGTWVHRQVAINLAKWCSPTFAVQVSKWVFDWMRGIPAAPSRLPYHLRRYVANQRNVPDGHFSVLTEMILALVAPLEATGYHLPERLWPDISQGKMFANYLRSEMGVDVGSIRTYTHDFEDGRLSVQAKAYPNSYLPIFRSRFLGVWMPQRLISYFKEKDQKALRFLRKTFPAIANDSNDEW